MKQIRSLAIYFMMLAFGAGFANTVVTRIALWVGRTRYLLDPLAKPVLIPLIIVTALVLAREDLMNYLKKRQ